MKNLPQPITISQRGVNESNSGGRFLFGLLCFFVFPLLSFSHDRSPCVVEIA